MYILREYPILLPGAVLRNEPVGGLTDRSIRGWPVRSNNEKKKMKQDGRQQHSSSSEKVSKDNSTVLREPMGQNRSFLNRNRNITKGQTNRKSKEAEPTHTQHFFFNSFGKVYLRNDSHVDHRTSKHVLPIHDTSKFIFIFLFVQVAARVEKEAGSKVLVNACCPGERAVWYLESCLVFVFQEFCVFFRLACFSSSPLLSACCMCVFVRMRDEVRGRR